MAHDRGDEKERETTYSGEAGRRERSTPGRAPRDLGLDPEEMRGHDVLASSSSSDRAGADIPLAGEPDDRTNPGLTPGVETMGQGGISMSGGAAGGDRGHGGTSDSGAGGPEGESRGGPGEYKSTSRGDLDDSGQS